jgi:catechol 2,3-dioxygenase-like lactoylglutathione lyase family enzyme
VTEAEVNVRTIHHVQLAMPFGGEPAADEFYGELLGLERLAKPPHLEARGGRWFRCRGSDLEVHLGVEEPFTPARKAHPAFVVDDLDAVRTVLEQRRHEIVEDTELEGYERFYLSDPFGTGSRSLRDSSRPTPRA